MESSVKKPHRDLKNEENESTESQEQTGVDSLLILPYCVLRIIFKNLNAKDLSTAACVCTSWRDAATSELAYRQDPELLLKQFVTEETDDLNVDETFSAKFLGSELRIKPVLGLVCEKVEKEDEWKPEGCYCYGLPSSCDAVILSNYDIVVDDTKVGQNLGMAACAFIPEIADLNHKVYYNRVIQADQPNQNDTIHQAEEILKQLLPSENEKSKCILMLNTDSTCPERDYIMSNLIKRYEPGTIALWGGLCEDLKVCQATSSKSPHLCPSKVQWAAITLSSPSLQSWSIVLPRSCRKESDMLGKFNNFKTKIELKKHSLGLMFACCARMKKKNLEIAVFKKAFPNVPLIGLHGDGEYGLNTLNEKRESTLEHQFTTIFLILTYQ